MNDVSDQDSADQDLADQAQTDQLVFDYNNNGRCLMRAA